MHGRVLPSCVCIQPIGRHHKLPRGQRQELSRATASESFPETPKLDSMSQVLNLKKSDAVARHIRTGPPQPG